MRSMRVLLATGILIVVIPALAAAPGLAWSAFLGGAGVDRGNAIAVDGSGNVYVAGSSDATWGNPIRPFGGGQDAFVAKLGPDGALLWLTFLGGAGVDTAGGIAVDDSGNVYVAGTSGAGWGSPLHPFGVLAGSTDAFTAKLGPGGALLWHTFFGFGQSGGATAIALDGAANPVITGYFSFGAVNIDAFASKLTANGLYQWVTFLGGLGRDQGNGVAVDGSGNVLITGTSESSWGSPRRAFGVSTDAFAAKLNPIGTLQWNTFLGGSGEDDGAAIAVDASGNAHVAGTSEATWGNPVAAKTGLDDAFAAKLSTNGALLWNTFSGGSGLDAGSGIAVDGSGSVFITGSSHKAGGDPAHPSVLHWEVFALKLNTSGLLQWSTSYHSAPATEDLASGIAVEASGNVDIAGTRWSSTSAADAFAIRLSANALTVISPNGGETWAGGTIHDILWRTAGTVSKVKLEYSANSGTSWTAIAASVVNADKFAWTVPSIASAGCLVRVREATTGTPSDTSDAAFSITLIKPKIVLNRTRVSFGATAGGPPAPGQTVMISSPEGGVLHWTATPSAAWITATPASGTGAAIVTIGVIVESLAPGTYSGSVAFADASGAYASQSVAVLLKIYASGTTTAPFGHFDTPADGTAGIAGSLPVTGWALDDVEATEVQIRRDADPADPPAAIGADGKVLVGYATFVEDARPDVEAAYPSYPLCYRGGWGYMMLTNFLPHQGNGTYKITAVAKDREGNVVTLGSKTFSCDNARAAKPFGAIDTPAQGGDARGAAFVNFGWALTPLPGTIPKDGSTIRVFVDGVEAGSLGTPPNVYNQYRSDVSTLFPGLNNSQGPVGAFFLDTTKYANGAHTIAWAVKDDLNREDGIGSRYFNIVNTGAAPAQSAGELIPAPAANGLPERPSPSIPIRIKRGFGRETSPTEILPDESGVYRVEMSQADGIEIEFGMEAHPSSVRPSRTRDGGFLLIGDERRPLPIGSTLDSGSGRFSWMPGPAFLGSYEIVLSRSDGAGGTVRYPIRVTITAR